MRQFKAALAGIVLAVIIVAPPWALLRYIGNPWPAEGVALSAPLTDGAIIGLLAAIVWVLWAQLVACVAAEVVAAMTDDRVHVEVPFALGIQQHLARRLVTAVVIATVTTPLAAAALTATGARATTPAPSATVTGVSSTRTVPAERAQHAGPARQAAHGQQSDRSSQPGKGDLREHNLRTSTVTVMRLDSLWSIAERQLGDGNRWPEIAALNEGRTMSDGSRFHAASHIRPGWELRVPARPGSETTASTSNEVIVEKGDTLSGIARDELGDPEAYPRLFAASTDIVQPGGEHLTDPDLIKPGWTVLVPREEPGQATDDGSRRHRAARMADPEAPQPRITDRAVDARPFPRLVPTPSAINDHDQDSDNSPSSPSEDTESDRRPQDTQHSQDSQDTRDNSGDGEHALLSALLATAGGLAAGALALATVNRRRQIRRRRIGRMVAAPPAEVVPIERAITEHGSEAQEDVTFLDRAMRHLAASCAVTGQPLPPLGAAVLGDEDLTLLFTQPAAAAVPEGWTATDDARSWLLPRSTILDQDLEAQAAPYPALVSIGLDDHDRTWIIDLESIGLCGIGGEPQQVADLARFMVAELAVNRWSEGSEVLLTDQFGVETIGINPARLREVQLGDAWARATSLASDMTAAEQALDADVLARRRDVRLLDSTHPVVIVSASRPDEALAAEVTIGDRSRVVIVHCGAEFPAIEVSGDGAAFLPMWGVQVNAFCLPTQEAAAMAALLASTRTYDDEPVPDSQSDDGPLGRYARADGSLRPEYTEARHTEGEDSSSMLPDADEVYLSKAATTAGDLAAVAPSVPEATRLELAALDPTLDQDVADWLDPSCHRPKVHLLGPVEVTALNGGDPTAIDNLGGTISFIAYLTCQDRGVTGERAAAACAWKTQRTVQNRATNARYLLGTRPDGGDWLPDASLSEGARRGSSPTYDLVRGAGGVLNSADLFIRLRHRAERRGDRGGCEQDLATALSLVTGAPFEAVTEHRFRWLFQPGQQRHDEILVGAVHDTAHLLATRALADGRTDLVRLACAAARNASPHGDVAWLDQAAATEADEGAEEAGQLVRDHVLDAYDEDLPARSEAVVDRREWWAAG